MSRYYDSLGSNNNQSSSIASRGNIEYEFRVKYGCYPELFYFKKLGDGLSTRDAFQEVMRRIEIVWKEMLYNLERQKAEELSPLSIPVSDLLEDADPFSF